MMHAHSPSAQPLAVPGIGFAQSAGNLIDLAAFRRSAAAPAKAPGMIDFVAAGFIVMSVAFGPVLAWLLLGTAAG